MNKEYFNTFEIYENPNLIMRRYSHSFQFLSPSPNTIMDTGCGDGYGLVALRKQYPSARLIGVEISERHLENARRNLGNLENISLLNVDLLKSDIEEGPIDDIVCTVVLEHVPEWKLLLSKLIKLAEKKVVVTVPYKEVLQQDECPYCNTTFNYFGHVNSFSEGDFLLFGGEKGVSFAYLEMESSHEWNTNKTVDDKWLYELCPTCLGKIKINDDVFKKMPTKSLVAIINCQD